jgi:ATP-dependent Clp endopeptidase proteolytic subunit ClpP
MPKSWFTVKNSMPNIIDVEIHDEIGMWGVSAKEFISSISDKSISTINLSINSPGGSLFDGLAMYHALKEHPATVNSKVLAIAGSAASIILMAGDHISMPEDTYVFIHHPSSGVFGNAEDFREAADLLDRFSDNILNIYERRTSMDREELKAMMAREEFISAKDAVRMGFADEVTGALEVAANAASFERYFKSMPKNLIDRVSNKKDISNNNPESIKNIQELESFLREAGNFSKSLAVATVSKAREVLRSDSSNDLVLNDVVSKIKNFKLNI